MRPWARIYDDTAMALHSDPVDHRWWIQV